LLLSFPESLISTFSRTTDSISCRQLTSIQERIVSESVALLDIPDAERIIPVPQLVNRRLVKEKKPAAFFEKANNPPGITNIGGFVGSKPAMLNAKNDRKGYTSVKVKF